MGIAGAGLATVIAAYSANAIMLMKLTIWGPLKISDLLRVPNPLTFLPILREGTQLSLRSLLFTALLATTSSFLAQRGAVTHAAYELCRQTSILIYVAYSALDQTVNALSATYVGRDDFKSAREIVLRIMQVRALA